MEMESEKLRWTLKSIEMEYENRKLKTQIQDWKRKFDAEDAAFTEAGPSAPEDLSKSNDRAGTLLKVEKIG